MKSTTSAVIAAIAVSLLAYLFLPGRPAVPTPTVYSKIQARKTIRAAYFVGAPLFTIDPNTKQKSGIFYEVVEKAAEKLGLSVSWTEEVGYGEMIQGLNSHRYDIVGSGVWINAARGKDADFTIPVYYDAVRAYTRPDDTRFDKDISVLNSPSYTISTMDGELGAAIASSDYPNAKKEELPQNSDFSQLILNVINKKADLVFLAVAPAREYLAKNPGTIRPVEGKPVRVFPIALILPQGEYTLKQSLDYSITEMLTSGEIETILRKYENVQGSFIRTALPYLDTGDLAK